MPQFNREIISDNVSRSVVKFTHVSTASLTGYALTGSISPLELSGGCFSGLPTGLGITQLDIGISKVFWSVPRGMTTQALEVAWGLSGSLTGQPTIYFNGFGCVDFAEESYVIRNLTTGPNRNSTIQIRNTSDTVIGDSFSIILELDKNAGYSLTAW